MTIAQIGTATSNVLTDVAVTLTRTVTVGSMLVVTVNSGANITNVAALASTGWVLAKHQTCTDAPSYQSNIFYYNNVGVSGSLSVTFNFASSNSCAAVMTEWSGMGTSTLIASAGDGNYGNVEGTGSTGTLSSQPALAVATHFAAGSSGTSTTPMSGWALQASATGFVVYDSISLVATATTALNPTWSTGGNVENANAIAVFAPGAAPPVAVLSAPTSSSISSTTATVGATTTSSSGVLYVVAATSGTTPSVAQIKAGQNSAGATVPSAAVGIGASGAVTANLTGLTSSTAYTYYIVHTNAGGDSNIVSGTFTTHVPSPTITSVSTLTPAYQGSLTITGTVFGSTQGTGTVMLGGTAQVVTSWSATSIVITVDRGANKYGTAVNVVVTNNNGDTSNTYGLTSVQPQSGWSYVDLGTVDTTASERLTSVGDLVSGDEVTYDNVSGGVTVFSNGTFVADATVSSFNAQAWSSSVGWGINGLQTLNGSGGGGGGGGGGGVILGKMNGFAHSTVAKFNNLVKATIASINGLRIQ